METLPWPQVNIQTNLQDFSYGTTSVIRRYSDFVWLAEQLAKDVPGSIVPPLPEKALVGKFSSEFIESRRRSLEKFLTRLSVHDELSESKYFKLFLQANDAGLASAKAESRANQSSEKKGGMSGLTSWFDDTMNSISISMNAGSETKERSPADEKIEEVIAYVNNLEIQMGNVAKHTTGLMKKNRELANGLFEFGLAFTLLGQAEAKSLSKSLTALGHTSDQLSILVSDEVSKESAHFEEPMYDYIRVLGAVKAALAARSRHKHALALATVDLENKKAAAAKLATMPGKIDKYTQAEHSVEKAQGDVATARDAFEQVSARVIREMERFKREKASDMRRIVLDYTSMQIEYTKKVEEKWASLLPELEAITDDDSSDDHYYGRTPPPVPPPPSPSDRPSASAPNDIAVDSMIDNNPDLVGV